LNRHVRQDEVLVYGEDPVAKQKEVSLAVVPIRLTRASSVREMFGVFDNHRVRLYESVRGSCFPWGVYVMYRRNIC
jgi:hypothetical protein